MILTSDTHFTSNDAEEYRWDVFDDIQRLLRHDPDKHVYILGDLTDRRDRHPSDLVNRLVDTFSNLGKQGAKITVLCGNHDRPLYASKPYWSFLSTIDHVKFIREPTADGRLLMLPFADKPAEAWHDITMALYHTVFCHQTFRGADRGDRISDSGLSLVDVFPPSVKVYSGDIHIPQDLGQLTYVGAPHHIKFGDSYRCRLLLLNSGFRVVEDVTLHPPSKHGIKINGFADLRNINVRHGDAARIQVTLPIERIDDWPEEQARITVWAKQHGITLAGIEPIVETGARDREAMTGFDDPIEIILSFADAEGLDEDTMVAGLDLMEAAKGVVGL